ncbi:hypothetical protein [Nonomuraea sp. NPDC050540]|uniref:hypothetical protein n=1 Tax=Nonomuraea sp. NPDC050540 TaxID=3364367 RepID=UPI0037A8CA58
MSPFPERAEKVSTIVATACDFGYGPAAKLDSIAQYLSGFRLVVHGTRLGQHICEFAYDAAYDTDTPLEDVIQKERPSAVLSVLDPQSAVIAEKCGVPVVYVDSLPFLWSPSDAVPFLATAYCAQMCPSIPHTAWPVLRRIEHLHWVEGIVPEPVEPASGQRGVALISVGGVESPVTSAAESFYANLVLQPAIEALDAAGYERVVVAGNHDALMNADVDTRDMTITVDRRQLRHREFVGIARYARIVLTSPGLTTITECVSMGVPICLLPPQNLSQIFNARHALEVTKDLPHVGWPPAVFDVREVERLRLLGEEAAVKYIVDSLAAAGTDTRRTSDVRAALRRNLEHALLGTRHSEQPSRVPAAGASQIAEILRSVVSR